MEELTGFIDDVRHNNQLYSVTLPGRWHFKHDGNLATIIKGVLTLGQGSKAVGPRSKPVQDNLGQYWGSQPPRQGGLNLTLSHLK